jgi:hypothetical protein
MKHTKRNEITRKLILATACVVAVVALWSANNCCAQQPPSNLPAGVQDVVKLTKAGMSEDVILAQVKNAGATYNLTADQLIYLSDQGVSQNVIKSLMAAPGSPAVTTPPTTLPSPTTPPTTPPPTPGIYAPTPVTTPLPQTPAPALVSFDYFRGQLNPYGAWVQVPGYGWCWRPSVAAADPFWRPYDNQGHWVYTDGGWFWQSDYPWGEIVFHYGRWFKDSAGWLWVPGYDWAPAWVCWRHADGYCGWAALPPGAVFRAGVGLEFGGRLALDADFGLGAGAFVFAPYDHFWDHNLHAFILPHERAEEIFHRSVVMNGYHIDHGRFIMDGLGRERIAGFTHHEVRVESPVFRDEHIQRHFEFERRGFREGPGRDERRDFR